MDLPGVDGAEAPDGCAGAVAEEGRISAGELGREQPALAGEATRSDGVDAAVDAMEIAAGDQAPDLLPAEPKSVELLDRDQVLLTGAQLL